MEALNSKALNVGGDSRQTTHDQNEITKPRAIRKEKRKHNFDKNKSNSPETKKRKSDYNSSENSIHDESKKVLLVNSTISNHNTQKATTSNWVRPSSSTISQRFETVQTTEQPRTKVTVPAVHSTEPLDMKSRLKILEDKVLRQDEHISNQQKENVFKVKLSNQRIAHLEKINQDLDKTVKAKECEASTAQVLVDDLQMKLKKAEEENQRIMTQQRRQEDEMSAMKKQKENLESDLNVVKSRVMSLKRVVAATVVEKKRMLEYESQMRNHESAMDGLRADKSRLNEELIKTRKQIEENEEMSRKNVIREFKNGIRVLCRVRPLVGNELRGSFNNFPPHLNFPDSKRAIELKKFRPVTPDKNASVKTRGSAGKSHFNYDRVFSPTSSQNEVFEEVSHLVQSSIEGHKVCILTYGQTGSGKTFTMEGGNEEKDRGMICRASEKIFSVIEDLKEKGWQYDVEVSFLHIYDEKISNLLSSNAREDTNLDNCHVMDANQVKNILRVAAQKRSVPALDHDDWSSKAHTIFRIKITGKNNMTKELRSGILNMVDSAGSEHLRYNGSQGSRMRETTRLNRSLSNLSNAIVSLANKEHRIMWANSTTTRILQPDLCQGCLILVIVHVHPSLSAYHETLKTLTFSSEIQSQGSLIDKDEIESKLKKMKPERRRFAISAMSSVVSETTVKYIETQDFDGEENCSYEKGMFAWRLYLPSKLYFLFTDLEFTATDGGFRAAELNFVGIGAEEFKQAQQHNQRQIDPERMEVRIAHKLTIVVNPLVEFRSLNSKLSSEDLKGTKILDASTVQLITNFLRQFKDICLVTHSDQDLKILLAEVLSLRLDTTTFTDAHFINTDSMFQALRPSRRSYKLRSIFASNFGRYPHHEHSAEFDAHALMLCCLKEKHFLKYVSGFVSSVKEVIPHVLRPRK